MTDQSEKVVIRDYPVPISESYLPSTEYRESFPTPEDSVDFRDYLEMVLRRKWLVFTVLVGTLMAALIVNLSMQPLYKATGRLELSINTPKVTKFEDMSATQLQTREFIQTQVKLLQSQSLARRVIEKLHLEEYPAFNSAVEGEGGSITRRLMKRIKAWIPLSNREETPDPAMKRLRELDEVEKLFAKSFQVQPERDTTIVSLTFSSPDAALSRDVINTLIEEFVAWQMDKRIDAAVAAKQQLEKQLEVVRIQLERAEKDLNEFAQKAGIVSLNSNLNLVYRQLEEMNNALASAETDRINKEAFYNQALLDGVGATTMVIDNQLIQRLREEYIRATSEYQENYVTFKDDYPRVKNLKARIQDIKSKIAVEEARILDSMRNSYFTALQREETLEYEAEAKKALALEFNGRTIQYRIHEREVETNKLIHQSLLERSKEIDAKVGTELGNVQVVDHASLPLKPYKPDLKFNLLIAMVLGSIGGIGAAFSLEYLDNTVKRVDEISDRFQIPILGVLPLAEADEVKDLDALVRLKPRSGFSEAIRTAKVSIQLSGSMDEPLKSLVITSTLPGQGKSTVSCNLAQAFATSDERVLLIDADLRKPRLHKVFSSNGNGASKDQKGLSQLLSGICRFDEVLQKTDTPNLYFISAGPIPPNPAEMLASNRTKQVLHVLEKHFDRVIVDAPPAAGFADVLVLGNYASGVLLVTTLGQTHREALRIFRKSLFNVRGRLLGCIINKLYMDGHYGGTYYKYYKYYGQYYQPADSQDTVESLPLEVHRVEDVKSVEDRA